MHERRAEMAQLAARDDSNRYKQRKVAKGDEGGGATVTRAAAAGRGGPWRRELDQERGKCKVDESRPAMPSVLPQRRR